MTAAQGAGRADDSGERPRTLLGSTGAQLAGIGLVLAAAALWVVHWTSTMVDAPILPGNVEDLARMAPGEAAFLLGAATVELVMVSVMTAVLLHRWSPRLDETLGKAVESPRRTTAVLAGAAAALALALAFGVLRQQTLLDDEDTYLFQARLLLSGRLSVPVPADAFPFYRQFIVEANGSWSGQYFWAQPALLALGILAGSAWLVPPLELAVTVYCTGRAAAELSGDERTGVLAAALAASSPLLLLTGGTLHNANLAAACAAASVWAMARLARHDSVRAALALGVATGIGLHARVSDQAFLIAGGAVVLLVVRRRDLGRLIRLGLVAAAAVLPFVVVELALNRAAYGDWLTNGYQLFNGPWGWKTFGFGVGPFGKPHTPEIAIAKTGSTMLRLSFWLAGAPALMLLYLLPATRLARRWRSWAAPAAVAVIYFTGYFFYAAQTMVTTGPVYFASLAPVLLTWLAAAGIRAHDALRATATPVRRRAVPAFIGAAWLSSALAFWPPQLTALALNADQSSTCETMVERAGITRGLVLVDLFGSAPSYSWRSAAPPTDPPFDAPLLWARSDGPLIDAATARRFAGDRPVFLARCKRQQIPLLLRYDPATSTVTSLDGSESVVMGSGRHGPSSAPAKAGPQR